MNLDNFTDEELLDRCIDCAMDIPGFSCSYLNSLEDSLNEFGQLTEGQRDTLENIAIKWRMF